MSKDKLPTYKVEIIYPEHIILQPVRRKDYFKQFVDNIALAVVTGTVELDAVFYHTTPSVFKAIQESITRFDEINELYRSRSTLEGVDEYLEPNNFTFRNRPHDFNS